MKRTLSFQPCAASYPQLFAWLWLSCRGICHAGVAFFHSSPCTVPKVGTLAELLLILLLNLTCNTSVRAASVCMWRATEVHSFCSYILRENRGAAGVQQRLCYKDWIFCSYCMLPSDSWSLQEFVSPLAEAQSAELTNLWISNLHRHFTAVFSCKQRVCFSICTAAKWHWTAFLQVLQQL